MFPLNCVILSFHQQCGAKLYWVDQEQICFLSKMMGESPSSECRFPRHCIECSGRQAVEIGQLQLTNWTNTFCKLYKYILQIVQIHFASCTNTCPCSDGQQVSRTVDVTAGGSVQSVRESALLSATSEQLTASCQLCCLTCLLMKILSIWNFSRLVIIDISCPLQCWHPIDWKYQYCKTKLLALEKFETTKSWQFLQMAFNPFAPNKHY